MPSLLSIIFSVLPILTFSQTIEKIRLSADSMLISIVTQSVFDTTFKYNCIKSSTIINNTYWNACGARTAKMENLFENEMRQANEIFFEIVYDLLLLDTIEGLVKVRLDKNGNIVRLTGINPISSNTSLLSLSINKQAAIDIGIKYGFETGLAPWTVIMTYEEHEQSQEKYYWKIQNTLFLGDKNGCNSNGETILIDASGGVISDKSIWERICVN